MLEEQHLRVNGSTLADICGDGGLPVAVDFGTQLIKIVYVTKATDEDAALQMNFATFGDADLNPALDFLKAKLQVKDSPSEMAEVKKRLRATGLGVGVHASQIRETLGVEIEYVDQTMSHCQGLSFLVKNCAEEDFCEKTEGGDDAGAEDLKRAEMFERFRESQKQMISEMSADSQFPCFLYELGSVASLYEIRDDGSYELRYKNELAGKSFQGISKLLVGTASYQQVLQLAVVGKRGNVDSQVRDLLDDNPTSHYGAMPPSMPLFGFGKAADFDKSLEDSRPEDVAQSLLSSFMANLIYPVTQFACVGKVRSIYLAGGFFRHEFARSEVARSTKLFGGSDLGLQIRFLKFSHVGALGALLASK